MASNQRDMRQREKRAQRDKRHRRIIWIIIAIIIIIIAVMKLCEVDFNSIKDRFTDENGNFTLTQGVIDDDYPYSLDSSQDVILQNVNNKLSALTQNSYTVIKSSDGSLEYTFDHGYLNPMISVSGVYSLIYDQGSTLLRLDTTSDNIYEKETEDDILCAAVAKNGTVVYATSDGSADSKISVITKSLKDKMDYTSSYGYVVAIAINNSAKKIAFAAVNSENAQLKTKVYVMSVGSDEVSGEFDIVSGSVIDLRFSGNNLYVVGDTFAATVSAQNKFNYVYEIGDINTVDYAYSSNGDLLLAYNTYSSSSDSTLVRIKSNGNIKNEIELTGTVKDISASSSIVGVLTGNNITTYSLSNSQVENTYDVDDSVYSICCIGNKTFIQKQSVIDRIEVE